MKFARRVSPRVLAIVSVALLMVFVFSSSRSLAATTYNVKVGGEFMGSPLAKGGMVWYNGFDPAVIVIHPGDTVVWNVSGGVHTVTSAALAANGSFLFDSSRLITPADVLADMGPRKLLAPGSVFEFDTSTLLPGTYNYFCKIHPGMSGRLNVTVGAPGPRMDIVAGWGDHLYAVQAFAPQSVNVTRGTIVRWTLLNPMEPHTITGVNATGAPAWDSSPDFNPTGPPPVLLPGQSFPWTFNDVGTFAYFCKLHAYKVGASWVGMTGIVQVVADPAATLAPLGYGSLGLAIVALIIAIFGLVRKRGPSGPSPPQQ